MVLPNDDGIRPAGQPDECFYCYQKVGQLHDPSCVTVSKIVRYKVMLSDTAVFLENMEQVGVFERGEPHSWTPEECEGHKNMSSWCKSNALNHINWTVDTYQQLFQVHKEESGADCACGWLTFVFDCVVDEGPLVELRD